MQNVSPGGNSVTYPSYHHFSSDYLRISFHTGSSYSAVLIQFILIFQQPLTVKFFCKV